jgi:hypothetical protein
MTIHRFAIGFFLAQGVGAAVWWGILFAFPESRRFFLATSAPDVSLLAFVVADLGLFVGSSLAVAFGLWRHRPWAWPLLCLHAGTATYAALYCWTLTALTGGDALAGALLMTPSLVVPAWLAWKLRDRP